jgi:ATP-dependent DNA helicase RecQ
MMRGFAETSRCRRRLLLGYLGEELSAPCGNCDVCEERRGHEGVEEGAGGAVVDDAPFPAGSAVQHTSWGPGVVVDTEPDRLTVLFEREGYRVLALATVVDEGLLTATPA